MERDSRGPLIVCPNTACDGALPLSDGIEIDGMPTFACPRCGELFRLGSEHTLRPEVVDLRARGRSRRR